MTGTTRGSKLLKAAHEVVRLEATLKRQTVMMMTYYGKPFQMRDAAAEKAHLLMEDSHLHFS